MNLKGIENAFFKEKLPMHHKAVMMNGLGRSPKDYDWSVLVAISEMNT